MSTTSDDELAELTQWFTANGGLLHPSISLRSSSPGISGRGSYIALSGPDAVSASSVLLHVPLRLTLSVLNIPDVAPFWPLSFVEKYRDESHVLSRFLVVEAWLQGNQGFWWPYLQAIPQPQLDSTDGETGSAVGPFDTTLYWMPSERAWLKGTRLGVVTEEREQQWKEEFAIGISCLKEQTDHTMLERWRQRQPRSWEAYSWDLYKWAATVLTSRSFSSSNLVLWKPDGEPQHVLSQSFLAKDHNNREAPNHFPVLVPVLDTANHDSSALTSWVTEDGFCDLKCLASISPGSEVCIDYDANSNDKLLIGYGFMVHDNPHDRVYLTASTGNSFASAKQDKNLDQIQKGLSKEHGYESLKQLSRILYSVLGPSQEIALVHQMANVREKPTLVDPERSMTESWTIGDPCLRTICLLADKVILGLKKYHQQLRKDIPSSAGNSTRLQMARGFRKGQLDILSSNIAVLEIFLSSQWQQGHVLSIRRILDEGMPPSLRDPIAALLEHSCGIEPVAAKVLENGLHELTFTIWICLVWLQRSDPALSSFTNMSHLNGLRVAYGDPDRAKDNGFQETSKTEDEAFAIAISYLGAVQYAAGSTSYRSLFEDSAWTVDFLKWGLNVFRQENLILESQQRLFSIDDGKEHEELLFWTLGD